MWASSVLRPKKHGGSFGFHAAMAKTYDWDVFPDFKIEKIEFPSCPILDEVLATETSDPAIANGTDCGVHLVRSIVDVRVFPDSSAVDSKIGDPF